jgi:hypothetical protein
LRRITYIFTVLNSVSNGVSIPGSGGDIAPESMTSKLMYAPQNATNVPTRCASFALEMMSHGGLHHHVLGASIIDGEITLQCYDHSNIVFSEPLNFVADFPQFLFVLLLLMSLGRKEWGFVTALPCPAFAIPNGLQCQPFLSLFRGQSIILGGQSYTLEDIIYQEYCIIGRGTFVIQAITHQDDFVIKFNWPHRSTHEANVLEHAWKYARTKPHCHIANHLPRLLYHESDDYRKSGKGDRNLEIMVFSRLMPITQLTDAKDLVEAIRGIFRCSCILLVISLERN